MNAFSLLGDSTSEFSMSSLWVPAMILLALVAIIVIIKAAASRYKKIPPNAVGIFYGASYNYIDSEGRKSKRGFRVVAGGGALLYPIFEHMQMMSTAAFQTTVDENDIPNKDNVKINVKGVATCKISNAPEDLHNAAMAFLGKEDAETEKFVRNILIGHLRSIIGKLNIDEILRQRDTFNRRVIEESTEELKRLGITVITLVIQDVNDAHGYIDALGQKTVAEAKRDAMVKVAEADAETKKRVSDAQREAAVVTAENAVKTASAEKDRDVQRAQFKVLADTETAKANQALGIATADQEKILKVKQADRDAAEREAQVFVQQKEAARMEQQLVATVVRPAEADRQRAVIAADASKQTAVLAAEARKEVAVREAEGQQQANVLQGEGEASKTRAILTAQAEGQAAIKRQALLAEAEGQAAMKGKVLLAEAEGTQKLAEALAKMTTDARLILILDRLPTLLDRGGEAASKVAASIFSSVAAPLGNIDELRIIDVGGTGRGLDQLSTIVPNTVFKVLASLQAQGVDLKKILAKLGVNIDEVTDMLASGKKGPPAPQSPVPPAADA
jgi:flotillin